MIKKFSYENGHYDGVQRLVQEYVADCVALPFQITRRLKRATTLEFTDISVIIFIHC